MNEVFLVIELDHRDGEIVRGVFALEGDALAEMRALKKEEDWAEFRVDNWEISV